MHVWEWGHWGALRPKFWTPKMHRERVHYTLKLQTRTFFASGVPAEAGLEAENGVSVVLAEPHPYFGGN